MTTQQLNKILQPYWEEGWDGYCRFDDGWADLVHECHLNILEIDPKYKINQIKEKFGVLRFYYQNDPEIESNKIDDIIQKYELKSASTCEMCAQKGYLCKKKYWLKTLCFECSSKLGFEKKNEKIINVDSYLSNGYRKDDNH
jgi:hypothetical protein